ncbi:MAG: chemotaxis protein CheD [Coriobacteriia bacterium]
MSHARTLAGEHVIEVGAGRLAVADAPAVLLTEALGSCVGVALWDSKAEVGGLAHVMLPSPLDTVVMGEPARFASFAVPALVEGIEERGGKRRRLQAKLAGGAAMFRGGDSVLASIGQRNLEEVLERLSDLRVPVVAQDTGGSHARTVELHLRTGVLVVRSYLHGIREL